MNQESPQKSQASGSDRTNYYRCTKCKLACDVVRIGVNGGLDNASASLCCNAPVQVVSGRE